MMTENRTPRMISENKMGPRSSEFGTTDLSRKTFIYRIHDLYNNIPRTITLIRSKQLFKKWIEAYLREGKIRKNNKNIIDNTYNQIINSYNLCSPYELYQDQSNPNG